MTTPKVSINQPDLLPTKSKPVHELTDDELFYELRVQVNRSRNSLGHDRERTRAIASEAIKRGWKITPSKP